MQLRKPIEDYVGEIQKKIDSLRADGTNRVVALQNNIDAAKRPFPYKGRKEQTELRLTARRWKRQKAVEAKNKDEIAKLISDAEGYLKEHFEKDYYLPLKASCEQEKRWQRKNMASRVAELNKRT